MHPALKFSQTNYKNKTLAISSLHNKQNNKASVTESFTKKFSVGHHGLSDEADLLHQKKSIADEKISVSLSHSQNRTFAMDKHNECDIRYLNKILQSQQGSVLEILNSELSKNDLKSQDIRRFVVTLVEKLSEESENESEVSSGGFQLADSVIRPYLMQQIVHLQKNIGKLKTRQSQVIQLLELSKEEKGFLKSTLISLEEEQRQELIELESF